MVALPDSGRTTRGSAVMARFGSNASRVGRRRRGGGHGSRGCRAAGSSHASSGFSISMVPPHLAHRVLAVGRSPSFASSNL